MRRSLWLLVFLFLRLLLLTLLASLLNACEQQKSDDTDTQPGAEPTAVKPVADITAGKTIAEQACAQCHGADGATSHDTAPFLAGQHPEYLAKALQEYKDGIRKDNQSHEPLQAMDNAAFLNVAAYYNSLNTAWNPEAYKQTPKPSGGVSRKSIQTGKQIATPCLGCHGEDGNSTVPGIPTLAGLQYDYIKSAVHAYFTGDRKESKVIMQNFKRSIKQKDINHLAAYFSTRKPVRSPLPASGNAKSGKNAAKKCAGCHGFDGNSISAAMPSLAGQNQEYLIKALKAYRGGQRKNAMMRVAVKNLSNRSLQNLSAYFATQKPRKVVGRDTPSGAFDPIGDGAKIAASCNGCHGDNGNSTNKGIPSLSRQHPVYLTSAIKAYQDDSRKHQTMKTLVSSLGESDIEKVTLYYATQEPTAAITRKPETDDPQAVELASGCNGCHGENGNSTDPEVPTIAGQDAQYLATAVSYYISGARENEAMGDAVKELSKEQIHIVTTYYAGQTPLKPQGINMPQPPEELSQKCDRCHGENGYSEDPGIPRLAGQIQVYLEKALRDYHNGSRESTTMHAMSAVLGLAEIKAITTYYSKQ